MKAPSTWSLASRPELEIGGSSGDGPTSFGDVAGVGVLGSDLVVVGDSKANELRVFDRGGAFVRAFGRGGSGPGEFSRVLWSVHALGDRILATDNGGRAQLFAASGQLLSSWGRPMLERLVEPKRIGLLRGSGNAVQALDFPKDTAAGRRVVSRVVLNERGGAAGPTYEIVVRSSAYARSTAAEPASPLIFGPTSEVVARDDRICEGHSDRYRIACFNANGTPLFVIERATSASQVTEAMRQLAREGYVNGNRQGSSNEMVERLRAEASHFRYPERVPAFGRMMVADDGHLWVSGFNPAEAIIGPKSERVSRVPVRWSVYAPDGAWVADIDVPARFVPHAVANGHLYGVSLDVDDTESVTVWPIVGAGGRRR